MIAPYVNVVLPEKTTQELGKGDEKEIPTVDDLHKPTVIIIMSTLMLMLRWQALMKNLQMICMVIGLL